MKRLRMIGYLLVLLAFSSPAFGYSEEEMETLRMFYGDNELVSSSTRSEKPVSRVAENMTVVTAEEIEAMNAHTVIDVLSRVPGIQAQIKSPGVINPNVTILGSSFGHVRVMLDGVTLNNYTDNAADLSMIPVQIVERIEIILGPASSAWGSALGGVINIITKSPGESAVEGGASGSAGSRGTTDLRGEVSGTVSKFGYYLSGTELRSDGLRPTNAVQLADSYAKVSWKDDLSLTQATVGHFHGRRQFIGIPAFDYVEEYPESKVLFATLTHRRQVTEQFSLEGSFRTLEQKAVRHVVIGGTVPPGGDYTISDSTFGGSLVANWYDDVNSVTGGIDFDLAGTDLVAPNLEPQLRKWGFFASDTVTAGNFSFTPSFRYDLNDDEKRLFSPSLGITWSPSSSTIFRAYAGKGFSLPVARQGLQPERVFSVQVGAEQALPRWFWLKTNLFRNEVSNVITPDFSKNEGKQRRQGAQVELRTVPVCDTTLSAGYVFIDSTDLMTGKIVPGSPRYSFDLGLHYVRNLFRGSLTGHYIHMVSDPDAMSVGDTSYTTFIWDLNLSHSVPLGRLRGEVFFSGHNLFDGKQYDTFSGPNPGRWYEGGLRVKF